MNEQTTQEWEAFAAEQGDTPPEAGSNMKAVLEDQIKQLDMEDQEIARLEAALKEAKDRRTKLVEMVIPETFADMGLDDDSVIKVNGKGVTIKEHVFASPKAADKPKVYDWLEEHGHGGLIKRVVTVPFGRGKEEQEAAEKLVADYPDHNGVFERKVAPQTLRSFVTQELANGTDIPMELFNVTTKRVAQVK